MSALPHAQRAAAAAITELGEVALREDAAEAPTTKIGLPEAATTPETRRALKTREARGSRRPATLRASMEEHHRCPPMAR